MKHSNVFTESRAKFANESINTFVSYNTLLAFLYAILWVDAINLFNKIQYPHETFVTPIQQCAKNELLERRKIGCFFSFPFDGKSFNWFVCSFWEFVMCTNKNGVQVTYILFLIHFNSGVGYVILCAVKVIYSIRMCFGLFGFISRIVWTGGKLSLYKCATVCFHLNLSLFGQ